MGVDAGVAEKKVAFLACNGTKECAPDKAEYEGVKTCAGAQLTMNGTKKCAFGCIGFGDCEAACPFGAISMGSDGLPKVDAGKCVGCGKCAKVCPFEAITVENNLAYIDFTKCKLCKKCVAECPTGAIHAVNFPVIKPKEE